MRTRTIIVVLVVGTLVVVVGAVALGAQIGVIISLLALMIICITLIQVSWQTPLVKEQIELAKKPLTDYLSMELVPTSSQLHITNDGYTQIYLNFVGFVWQDGSGETPQERTCPFNIHEIMSYAPLAPGDDHYLYITPSYNNPEIEAAQRETGIFSSTNETLRLVARTPRGEVASMDRKQFQPLIDYLRLSQIPTDGPAH